MRCWNRFPGPLPLTYLNKPHSSPQTQSTTLINPRPPSFLFKYNRGTLLFIWNAPNIVINFLILVSNAFNSLSVHSKILALCLTTLTVHALVPFIKFQAYNLDYNNNNNRIVKERNKIHAFTGSQEIVIVRNYYKDRNKSQKIINVKFEHTKSIVFANKQHQNGDNKSLISDFYFITKNTKTLHRRETTKKEKKILGSSCVSKEK